MIKLVVSDLDGTLLWNHDRIHPENKLAIERLLRRGVRFAVASGRNAASCSILLEDVGLMDAYVIGVNGCQVWDKPFGREVASHFLVPGVAQEVMEIFQAHGLSSCLYTKDMIVYSDPHALEEGMYETPDFARRMVAAGVTVAAGPEAMREALQGRAMKAYCVYAPGQEEAFAQACAVCGKLPVSTTSSWRDNFEVMPVDVDKGTAVAELAASLGILREEVVAFGDSDNDLPMLRWAGHGYAMANAQPHILREIGLHAPGGNEAGVARVLRDLLGSDE